jgi:hypothetical protein
MSLLRDAFGTFEPHRDPDAGGKLVLDSLMTTNRLDDLAELLSDQSRLRRLEGDPGWALERRRQRYEAAAYVDWPEDATFRTFVDPEAYTLATPQRFYRAEDFHRLLEAILTAYARSHPGEKYRVRQILDLL